MMPSFSENRIIQSILDSLSDHIAVLDRTGEIIYINESWLTYAAENGNPPLNKIGKGMNYLDVCRKAVREDSEKADQALAGIQAVLGGSMPSFRMEYPCHSPAEKHWYLMLVTPLKREYDGIVISHLEITDRVLLEEQVRHMSQYDPLTDLPNRNFFMSILGFELAKARRNGTKLAILVLDLDRFKEINDTLGHEVGNELLVQVSKKLREQIRVTDEIARTGGDEFNIAITDLNKVEYIIPIIHKVMDAFLNPYMIAGHDLQMTGSIGISVYPDDSEDRETLFRYADIAMYYAKEQGRNTYQFYSPSINMRTIERVKLESELRRTLERRELVLYYQPQIDILSREIVSAEALVRWEHPEMGLLLPRHFIPLAEETGFISSIDKWVLKNVCGQVRSWLDTGLMTVCITVNLSARLFRDPDMVETVSGIMKESDTPPNCIDIEITESMAMSNIDRTAAGLKELTRMGIHISIDDFGTGYSSLNYLKRLPVTRLKVDKSFIQDIASDPEDRAIISAVTAMAHNMNMRVVAEGVENETQLSFLQETHCDEVQGFLFSEPLPAARFREYVAAGHGPK